MNAGSKRGRGADVIPQLSFLGPGANSQAHSFIMILQDSQLGRNNPITIYCRTTRHTITVPSLLPETSVRPSCDNPIPLTAPPCPVRLRTFLLVFGFQSRIAPSRPAEISRLPSLEYRSAV